MAKTILFPSYIWNSTMYTNMKRTTFFEENFDSEGEKHGDLHFNAMVCDGRNTDSKIMEKCRRIPVYESCIRSSLLN